MANMKVTIVGKFKDQISKGLSNVQDKLNKVGKESGGLVTRFASLGGAAVIGGVAALATGIAALGGASLNTARNFESLNARLKTVVGSQEEATKAFEFIKDLSTQIPGSLEEVTDSFIKLKALGLNPTKEAILAYSNVASGMGKPLNQFIEAVADASTNEFERLKEFGIKAKQEGDNVKFTFQGVTTTVKKNSADITKYLQGLGEVQFAGAATEQMKTLDGQMSNLGVAFDNFLSKFAGETNILDWAKKGVEALSGFLDYFTSIMDSVTEYAQKTWDFVGNLFGGFSDLGSQLFDALAAPFVNLFELLDSQSGGSVSKFFGELIDWFNTLNFSWQNIILQMQLAYTAFGKGLDDLFAKIKYGFNVAAISLISGFKKLPETFSRFMTNVANLAIDGINFMIKGTLDGINKIIEAVNDIPGVEISSINVDEKLIDRLKEVKETVDNVALDMMDQETKQLNATLAENEKQWGAIADSAIAASQVEIKATETKTNVAKEYNETLKEQEKLNLEKQDAAQKAEEAEKKAAEAAKVAKKKQDAAMDEAIRARAREMEALIGTVKGVFSSFFSDLMGDSKNAFDNLVTNFKRMVDNLVAEALAAKVMKALFGDIGLTTNDKGKAVSAGSEGGILSSLFNGIFGREMGGPVQANMPYIVGEKRPELFVPRQDGTIVPNLAMAGGGNMQVSISAIDSKGVADFIETNKFAMASAVQNTVKRYNVR